MLNSQKGFSNILIAFIVGYVLLQVFFSLSYIPGFMNSTFEQVNNGFQGNFDVSSDQKQIIFPYGKDKKSYIYISKIDGSEPKEIENARNGYRPKFSLDGKKILFLSQKWEGERDSFKIINIANIDGSELTKLDPKMSYIKEAIFDPQSAKIFFVGSSSEDNLKSFLKTLDIYSYDLNNKSVSRITNKKYNKLYDLSMSYSGDMLYFLDGTVQLHQLYGKDFSQTKILYPSKDIIDNATMSSNSSFLVFSPPEFLEGRTYFDLYIAKVVNGELQSQQRLTQLKKKTLNPIVVNNGILFSSFSNWEGVDQSQMLAAPIFDLMEVGLDGSGLKKIDLKI